MWVPVISALWPWVSLHISVHTQLQSQSWVCLGKLLKLQKCVSTTTKILLWYHEAVGRSCWSDVQLKKFKTQAFSLVTTSFCYELPIHRIKRRHQPEHLVLGILWRNLASWWSWFYKETQDATSHQKLLGKLAKVKEHFRIDWANITWKDLEKPFYFWLAVLIEQRSTNSKWHRRTSSIYWRNIMTVEVEIVLFKSSLMMLMNLKRVTINVCFTVKQY